ncbi:MAG TPA: glycosyltransferase family 4 protein, partial [Candidatus Saccharimonadales bacterium]|nr:glycosyltransferase family 4 protein [Candidatus Saccharimonadales bacterium]
MSQPGTLKVAIVCDWLTGIGGAERVVLELHRLYPDAPIYTSQYDPSKIDWFKDADVRTTWLQRLPSSLKKFLPL